MNREYYNNETLIQGDDGIPAGEYEVRPVSLGSMLILKKLGSQLYNLILSGEELKVEENLEDLISFLWVHVTPWETVRNLVARMPYTTDQISEAILDFSVSVPQEQIAEMVQVVMSQKEQTNSAMAKVVPRKGEKKTRRK